MPDETLTIKNTVPISRFDSGQAEKIFEDVKKNGVTVVTRDNEPVCVLLSPEDYVKLMDEIDDERLLSLASSRMDNYDPSSVLSEAEVLKELGISGADLTGADTVALE